jgi:hypothetical protein
VRSIRALVDYERRHIQKEETSLYPTAEQVLSADVLRSLEERFMFLMKQLKINDTADLVSRFVRVPQLPIDREAEIVAAGGTITAAEKKAEGLAD